jgi:hypothetical protein
MFAPAAPQRQFVLSMDSKTTANEIAIDALRSARESFLALHTLLLGLEREDYERYNGPATSHQMLKLVLEDERFAWLRSISELIVRFDILLDGDEPVTEAAARSIVEYASGLLTASPTGNPFQKKYDAALQNEPDVIFAHRDVQGRLTNAKVALRMISGPDVRLN